MPKRAVVDIETRIAAPVPQILLVESTFFGSRGRSTGETERANVRQAASTFRDAANDGATRHETRHLVLDLGVRFWPTLK